MRRVIIESPYKGDIQRNIMYAKRAVLDALHRGEAPLASHLLFTQPGILDDNHFFERALGMDAGHAWIKVAEAVVLYEDLGRSSGMVKAEQVATKLGIPVEHRKIGEIP